MRNKMSFYNKEKNNNTIQSLANVLANKKADNINTAGANFNGLSGGVSTNVNKDDNWGEGAGNLIKGGMKLYSGLKDSGWFNNGGGEGSGLFASAANDYISGGGGTDYGIFGNAIASGGSGAGSSAVGNAISSEVGSSLASEAGSSGGWGGFGGGSSGGGTPWGAIAGVARTGYNTIMDKDGTEYSDLEQSTIYPLQGAAIGSQFGPWGAAGGALYGIGYSFKDDLGLKDNDWFTDIIFPIGMGDEHQGLIQL